MWHLAQLRNRKHRLNTLLLLLRVQLATTYALGWVAVILKGCTPFRLQNKDANFLWDKQVFFLFMFEGYSFFCALKCTFLNGDSVKFLSVLRRILWNSSLFWGGLCEILTDFVADYVKFRPIFRRILWKSRPFSDGLCEIPIDLATDYVKFTSNLRRIMWNTRRFCDGLCEILVDFATDNVKFLSISWRIMWNSRLICGEFREIPIDLATDSV